ETQGAEERSQDGRSEIAHGGRLQNPCPSCCGQCESPRITLASPSMGAASAEHSFDVVIIGSGFGGSVAALRLTEKGYRVAVLEAGRRFSREDFAKTSWDLRRYLFAPRLGLWGIQRLDLLQDVLILSGAGVGGGSLVYANTLYTPPPAYYRDPQWAEVTDWEAELAPHYRQAQAMLGVRPVPEASPSDRVIRRVAEQMGVAHTYGPTPV